MDLSKQTGTDNGHVHERAQKRRLEAEGSGSGLSDDARDRIVAATDAILKDMLPTTPIVRDTKPGRTLDYGKIVELGEFDSLATAVTGSHTLEEHHRLATQARANRDPDAWLASQQPPRPTLGEIHSPPAESA